MLPSLFLREASIATSERHALFVPAELALEDDAEYQKYQEECAKFERYLRTQGVQQSDGVSYKMAIDVTSLLDRRVHNDTHETIRVRERLKDEKLLNNPHSHGMDATVALYGWTHLPAGTDVTFDKRVQALQSRDRAKIIFGPDSPFCGGDTSMKLFDRVYKNNGFDMIIVPRTSDTIAGLEFARTLIQRSDYVFLHPTNWAAIFAVVVSTREEAQLLGKPWPPPDGQNRYLYVKSVLSDGFPEQGRELLTEPTALARLLSINTVLFTSTARSVWYHFKKQNARFVDNDFHVVDANDWALRIPRVFPLTRAQQQYKDPELCKV